MRWVKTFGSVQAVFHRCRSGTVRVLVREPSIHGSGVHEWKKKIMKERPVGSRLRRRQCRRGCCWRANSAGCDHGGGWDCSQDSGRSWMLKMTMREGGGREARMRMSTGMWMTTRTAPSLDSMSVVSGFVGVIARVNECKQTRKSAAGVNRKERRMEGKERKGITTNNPQQQATNKGSGGYCAKEVYSMRI